MQVIVTLVLAMRVIEKVALEIRVTYDVPAMQVIVILALAMRVITWALARQVATQPWRAPAS